MRLLAGLFLKWHSLWPFAPKGLYKKAQGKAMWRKPHAPPWVCDLKNNPSPEGAAQPSQSFAPSGLILFASSVFPGRRFALPWAFFVVAPLGRKSKTERASKRALRAGFESQCVKLFGNSSRSGSLVSFSRPNEMPKNQKSWSRPSVLK